ncbi:restriction endonuclease [Brachyspira catarrhinii]|uniref:Restriction endonuclease n=1 Tax=Brachyspira catarrhinii TaxID=2528966 RepID=A0ABY2TUL0_9SPIR|nr:restriction endonuclease [Brachyspira catarrhinii]TKZ36429.1 restriction endonuclease [Brachyspira catarrhinii]
MSNYYIHRISYHKNNVDIASPLLKDGNYLSIVGYANLYGDKLYDIVAKKDKSAFKKYLKENKSKKSAQNLWRFLNFKKDDLIIVPSPKKFSVYKIVGDKFVGNEDKELLETLEELKLKNREENGKYILGYFWKVEPVAVNISRSKYAEAVLTRRMRFWGTNINCNKIKDLIDSSIKRFKENKPIDLFSDILDKCRDNILELVKEKLNDLKFEELIQLYFKQCGANKVKILPKNDKKKGDCDVEAVFEPIKTVIHVQAKFYKGVAGKWAVEQISDFIEFIENKLKNDEYIRIGWVVSTCDDFSDKAKKLADENNILLINGETFAEMLIRSGIHTIDKNL